MPTHCCQRGITSLSVRRYVHPHNHPVPYVNRPGTYAQAVWALHSHTTDCAIDALEDHLNGVIPGRMADNAPRSWLKVTPLAGPELGMVGHVQQSAISVSVKGWSAGGLRRGLEYFAALCDHEDSDSDADGESETDDEGTCAAR